MTSWRPQPRAMEDDARLLLLGPEAQAVAWRLSSRASGGRVLVGAVPEAAVTAICGGATWASQGLRELLRGGFVSHEGESLELVWEWPTLASDVPSARSVPPPAPAVALSRSSDARAAERRLRALWSRYAVDTSDARVAWVDSPTGARFLDREQRDRAWALDLASRTVGDNRGRFGCRRAVTTHGDNSSDNRGDNSSDNRGDNPAPLPAPLSQKREQENTTKDTQDSAGARGDNPHVTGGDNQRAPDGDNLRVLDRDNSRGDNSRAPVVVASEPLTESGVRCGTVEHLGVDPEAALFAVRTRSRGSKINLASDSRSLAQWSTVVKSLTAPTLRAFEALGDWLAAGGLGWWSQGRPSLAYLLRPGQLATHLEDAALWDSSGRPPITHARSPSARPSVTRARGPAPVSAAFAPKDDPEMMAIFALEQAAFR